MNTTHGFKLVTKRAFSLLEVMVAIALIGIVGSSIISSGASFLQYYKEKLALRSLEEACLHAKTASLLFQCDILISLHEEGGKVICRFSSEEPLAAKFLPRNKKISITGVKELCWNKSPIHDLKMYLSNGKWVTQGALHCSMMKRSIQIHCNE